MVKKTASTPGSHREDDLAQAVNRLTDMLGVVGQTLTETKNELSWIINNRCDIPLLQQKGTNEAETGSAEKIASLNKPESIACGECDIADPGSLASALAQGWTELTPDDGVGWNYIGLCPHCRAAEFNDPPGRPTTAEDLQPHAEEEPEEEKLNPEKTLFG